VGVSVGAGVAVDVLLGEDVSVDVWVEVGSTVEVLVAVLAAAVGLTAVGSNEAPHPASAVLMRINPIINLRCAI